MKKIQLTPWSERSQLDKMNTISYYLREWPELSSMDRKFVMREWPEAIKAAGLWPGIPGDEELIAAAKEWFEKGWASRNDPNRWPKTEWHELDQDVRDTLCASLRKDWPGMSASYRQYIMQTRPEKVKEAGLWPEGQE